jgi:exopolysaccharide biosynthesis operon protein EpsL
MRVRRLPVVLLLACWSFSTGAAFDPTDVVQIQASYSLAHDNNLYRLPESDPTLFGINPDNKADRTRIVGVGLRFDKLISRQRLIAEANLNETTYERNTNLDFFGGTGRISWLWQIGNHWSGDASYRKSRTLGGFADFRQATQDLIDNDTFSLSGGYQLHPRWRIAGELIDQESKHSATVRNSLDFTAKTAGVTLTYKTPANNSISLQGRRTEGKYPNRQIVGFTLFDNSHTETRVNVLGVWAVSGAMRLDGQIGHVDRKHELLSNRDFSGPTWRAGATWEATGKLRVVASASKDIRTFEDIATSYIAVTDIVVSPTYALTPKVLLQGDFSYQTRDFRGDPGFLLFSAPSREDKLRIARMSVTYSPIRNVDLSLAYENGDRRSTNAINGFDYQSWFGTVRLSY